MEINRNQWLVIGVLIFLVGLQLRAVSAYWLTEETTRFLAKRSSEATPAESALLALTAITSTPPPRKVLQPPDWSGWCLISVGSVVILQSLVMRKPG